MKFKTGWVLLTALAWATPAVAQSGSFGDPGVEQALQRLKKTEPSIQEAQAAALKFFRIDPDTIGSMRSRAGWKSVLPAVRVGGRLNSSTVDSNTIDRQIDTDANFLTGVNGDVKELVVEGAWDLPRLVFNAEVLDVSSLVVLQESILKGVTRLYYTRRRLQIDLILKPPTDVATRLSKELRVEELTATLDAMTGNLFTRYAQRVAQFEQRRQEMRKRANQP